MNRSGDPSAERHFDAEKALKSVRKKPVDTGGPRLHTLDEAAELIDTSPDAVREDPARSVRAGAALLAGYQRRATGNLPDDPSVEPVQPAKVPLAATRAGTADVPAPECPAGLNRGFRPAAYEQNGGPDDWGDYNVADRPAGGHDIRHIAPHDTEGSHDGSLAVFRNSSTHASAHYMVRASGGLVTQMVENKDGAWHAGDKTLDMHSIGIEHEGYAIEEGSSSASSRRSPRPTSRS